MMAKENRDKKIGCILMDICYYGEDYLRTMHFPRLSSRKMAIGTVLTWITGYPSTFIYYSHKDGGMPIANHARKKLMAVGTTGMTQIL